MAATANQASFPGFQFPTTTPVPDEVFDLLMPQLSGAELKVLLYICRRTFGFKKDADTISLSQIAQGITTRAGRVLDRGTGLCKRHVQRALKALEKKNIITVTRRVDESGLNEVNTYSLNMQEREREVGTKSPHPRDTMSPGVGTPASGGVGTPASPTTNREQETVVQETDNVVVVVAQDLENFGIAQSAAARLIERYPAAYIKEKLAMAQGLVASGSQLVSQNPAGWLRRAIEEDYSPPRLSQRYRQRHGREKQAATLAQAEPRDQGGVAPAPPVATEPEQNVSTEMDECPQTVPILNKEPEKKEAEPASPEHETIWLKTIAQVKEAQPLEDVAARLTGTTLLELSDTAARIGVPNLFTITWLERRLYREIANAIKGILGKDLDLQFVPAT